MGLDGEFKKTREASWKSESARSGVAVSALHFYEAKGLTPHLALEVAEQLTAIAAAQLLDFRAAFRGRTRARAPLLGEPQELRHWVVVITLTVLGWVVAAMAMRQYRARVPYWV